MYISYIAHFSSFYPYQIAVILTSPNILSRIPYDLSKCIKSRCKKMRKHQAHRPTSPLSMHVTSHLRSSYEGLRNFCKASKNSFLSWSTRNTLPVGLKMKLRWPYTTESAFINNMKKYTPRYNDIYFDFESGEIYHTLVLEWNERD